MTPKTELLIRTLFHDLLVNLQRLLEGLLGFGTLVVLDTGAADSPELLDHADAPLRTGLARADRLTCDNHVHGVRVHLRVMPNRNPRTLIHLHLERDVVLLVVRRDILRLHDLPVHDEFEFPRVADGRLRAWGGA